MGYAEVHDDETAVTATAVLKRAVVNPMRTTVSASDAKDAIARESSEVSLSRFSRSTYYPAATSASTISR